MYDATRSDRTSDGTPLGRREQHLTLAIWFARLAGSTPRTIPGSAPSTPNQAPVATARAFPIAARAAA